MPPGSIPYDHCFSIGVGVRLFDNIEELPNKSTLTLIVQYLAGGVGFCQAYTEAARAGLGPAPGGAGGAG